MNAFQVSQSGLGINYETAPTQEQLKAISKINMERMTVLNKFLEKLPVHSFTEEHKKFFTLMAEAINETYKEKIEYRLKDKDYY